MDMITVDDVLAGVERLSQKSRDNLAVKNISLESRELKAAKYYY